MAYEENDLVAAFRGTQMLQDTVTVTPDGPALAAFGWPITDMETDGWKVSVLVKAPKPGPQEDGFYLDDKLAVWRQKSTDFTRIADAHPYDETADNKLVFTKLEVASATAEKIAAYFESVSWATTAQRIREEFVDA